MLVAEKVWKGKAVALNQLRIHRHEATHPRQPTPTLVLTEKAKECLPASIMNNWKCLFSLLLLK
jgi:hypothetical protein